MTEEELVIFDILTRPAPPLSDEERNELKKVAAHLLDRLRDLLVLDWRKSVAARARIAKAIEDQLDTELPRAYSPEIFAEKCTAIFEHFYESYPQRDLSPYARET